MIRRAARTILLLVLILSGPAGWAHLASHSPPPGSGAPLGLDAPGHAAPLTDDAGECPVCLGRTAQTGLLSPLRSSAPQDALTAALASPRAVVLPVGPFLAVSPRGPPSHA